MRSDQFLDLFSKVTNFKKNPFHPLVWIVGEPEIGKNVYIGGMSDINCKGAKLKIGDNCDIASFVAINCADSHKKCIGLSTKIDRKDITIGNNVFIGEFAFIGGGTHIGHHSVISAGCIVINKKIPPYSLVVGNKIKKEYYRNKIT